MKMKWGAMLVAAACLLPVPVSQAAQYFAPRYSFTGNGQLQPALSVEFIKGAPKRVNAIVTNVGSSHVLSLGFMENDQPSLFAFQKGQEYALYKLDFRPNREDLLILSYGKKGTGRTPLTDITVIGEDALGVIRPLPVGGFIPVEVFNSPLQIRQKEAVLFLEQAPKVLRIAADGQYSYSVKI